MSKFLWNVSYAPAALEGLRREGAESRKAFIQGMVEGLGGTLESFYFAFGESDVIVIADLPSNAHAAAIASVIGASGIGSLRTTVLLTPAETDEAFGIPVGYRPPGE